jgi:hypothetical protein
MAKLKWDRQPPTSIMNSDYWNNPKAGFDKAWHEQRQALNKHLGTHKDHNWEPIRLESGPHVGKAICNTCNGKFIMWLPKNYFTNT